MDNTTFTWQTRESAKLRHISRDTTPVALNSEITRRNYERYTFEGLVVCKNCLQCSIVHISSGPNRIAHRDSVHTMGRRSSYISYHCCGSNTFVSTRAAQASRKCACSCWMTSEQPLSRPRGRGPESRLKSAHESSSEKCCYLHWLYSHPPPSVPPDAPHNIWVAAPTCIACFHYWRRAFTTCTLLAWGEAVSLESTSDFWLVDSLVAIEYRQLLGE